MQSVQQLKYYFWWFVIIHCTVWVVLPVFMRHALPHDTIEGFMWGQHLEWGYDKNPWMNAWLTRLGWKLGGTSGIGIYALSSFFVGLSFWSVWKLSNKIVSPIYALVSVLLLESCINYTLVPQGFNDNVIELGLWPLMFLCFYHAIEAQKTKYWLATGLVAGLALMAKYYTGVPLIIMALFLLIYKAGRLSFRHRGFYLGILIFIIIIFPHIVWLFQHNMITLKYALNRADDLHPSFWKLHLYNPLYFAFTQIVDFVLGIIIVLFLRFSSRSLERQKKIEYILWMSLGPLLLTVLLSMIFGWYLYNEWGVPLVTLWGLLLIIIFKPKISEKNIKKIILLSYIIMFLWAAGYIAGLYIPSKHKHSDNYPAQKIADYVNDQWQAKYHKPLKYIAGSRYIGGYMAFYTKDHPSVYVEWNDQFSPWIDINQMKKYGAVFIQDNYYGTTVFGKKPDTENGKNFPAEVLKQFPNLIILPIKYFQWERGNKKNPPIPVLMGFLPPRS